MFFRPVLSVQTAALLPSSGEVIVKQLHMWLRRFFPVEDTHFTQMTQGVVLLLLNLNSINSNLSFTGIQTLQAVLTLFILVVVVYNTEASNSFPKPK